jgi:hypothetical protein
MSELVVYPTNPSGGNSFGEAHLPVFAGRHQALPSFLGKLLDTLDRRAGESQLFGTRSATLRMLKNAAGKVGVDKSRSQFPPQRGRRTPRCGIVSCVVAKTISLGHANSARPSSKSRKTAIFSTAMNDDYQEFSHILNQRSLNKRLVSTRVLSLSYGNLNRNAAQLPVLSIRRKEEKFLCTRL